MKLPILAIAALAAGCSSSSAPHQLPSALAEPLPGPGPAAIGSSARPCGYDYSFFAVVSTSSGSELSLRRNHARITYNPAGLDVLEAATDDDDRFAFRSTFDYDAMGNLMHDTRARALDPGRVEQDWLVYDSFGRLLGHSTDLDGDGREDSATTYGYAGDGNPTRAHVADTQAGHAHDLAYHYDDDARLVQVDRDDGPDGIIDQTSRYEYDDPRRVTTMTTTDRAGSVLGRSTTTYDSHDHVLSVVATELDVQSIVTLQSTDSYVYDAGRLVSESHDGGSPGSGVRYDWRYDHCQ
jgi:hypothetical protein